MPSVSRRHARILVDGDGATLEDLGSKNGTLLNGAARRSAPGASPTATRSRSAARAMIFRVLQQTGSTETASGLKPRREAPAPRSR